MKVYYCFIILFTITISFSITSSQKVICNSSQTVYLNTNELTFFESLNFPATMEEENCEITFKVKNVQNLKALRVFLAVMNSYIGDIQIQSNNITWFCADYCIIKNYTEITIQVSKISEFNDHYSEYGMFQGMIIFDDWGSGCLLESISAIDPYKFVDETQIIVLTSDQAVKGPAYTNENPYTDEGPYSNCIWHFAAPYGYNFKLVIFNDFRNSSLDIVNEKRKHILIQNPMFDIKLPYYIEGSRITINYDGYDIFKAYLTIVKKVFKKTEINCTSKVINNRLYWPNIEFKGYPNNARCSLSLIVPWKNQYTAYIKNHLESYADNLVYFFDNQVKNSLGQKYSYIRETHLVIFQAHKNGYNNYVIFEFESDGSVESPGFQIVINENVCVCGPSEVMVPCSGTHSYNIMNNNDDTYCGNLDCIFTIITNPYCLENFVNFSLPYSVYMDPLVDKFSIISNNQTLEIITETEYTTVILPASHKNYFHFLSFPSTSLQQRSFVFQMNSIPSPKVYLQITLTNDLFYFGLEVLMMPHNSVAIIKIDEELIAANDTLEMFPNSYSIRYLTFYTDENFSSVIKVNNAPWCEGDNCRTISKSNKFVVYKNDFSHSHDFDTILFRATKRHTKNCVFKENVFYECDYKVNYQMNQRSMFAKGEGDCNIVFLKCPFLNGYFSSQTYINQVWTTSKTNAVKLYYGSNNQSLVQIREEDNYIWKDFLLSSPFLYFTLPSDSSFVMRFDNSKDLWSIFPYKTLWTSPFYGAHFPLLSSSLNLTYGYWFESNANVTVMELKPNAKIKIFYGYNKVYDVNFAGETFTFFNTNISINYINMGTENADAAIKIEAEKKKKVEEYSTTIELLEDTTKEQQRPYKSTASINFKITYYFITLPMFTNFMLLSLFNPQLSNCIEMSIFKVEERQGLEVCQ